MTRAQSFDISYKREPIKSARAYLHIASKIAHKHHILRFMWNFMVIVHKYDDIFLYNVFLL